MTNYTRLRNENIALLLSKRDGIIGRHRGLYRRVVEKFEQVRKNLGEIRDNRESVLNALSFLTLGKNAERTIKGIAELYRKAGEQHGYPKEVVEKRIEEMYKNNEKARSMTLVETPNRELVGFNSFFNSMSKGESKFRSFAYSLNRGLIGLDKLVDSSVEYGYVRDVDNLRRDIGTFIENTSVKDSEDMKKLIDLCDSEAIAAFGKNFDAYRMILGQHCPRLSREDLLSVARQNLQLFAAMEVEKNKETRDRFNNREGNLLSYVTYKQEAKKTEETEPVDLDYLTFLDGKADDKLTRLRGERFSDVLEDLVNLHIKGHVSENNLIFFKKMLELEFLPENRPGLGEPGTMDEDVQIRDLCLQDYGVPKEKSYLIARMIENDDIGRVYKSISAVVGRKIASQFIQNNPEIFLLDDARTGRYTAWLKDILSRSKQFRNMPEYNTRKMPGNFSSFDGLARTERSLDRLVHAGGTPRRTDEHDIVMDLLKNEGFDARTAMDILKYAFRFSGEYLVGSHGVSIDNLERNFYRHSPKTDKRLFHNTLRKLIQAGAVLKDPWSLNPHTKQIESEAIRRALNYTLFKQQL